MIRPHANAFFMPALMHNRVGRAQPSQRVTGLWIILWLAVASPLDACAAQSSDAPGAPSSVSVPDSLRVLDDLRTLSSETMDGRATGTPGNEAARSFVKSAFHAAGLQPVPGREMRQMFTLPGAGPGELAANVVGYVEGSERSDRFVVVAAHFDHLGSRGSEIYFGADDNASGTAALIELARFYGSHSPRNSIIFAAFDAEERGLRGARAFVEDPPVPLESIDLVINIDMIGRNDRNELFVAGTYPYPFLAGVVDTVAANSHLRILKGHDRPDGSAGDDWTHASDHGPFHLAGIPFLYFGVEDHEDYHRPTDTFEGIQQGFYVEAIRAVHGAIQEADCQLTEIRSASGRGDSGS